jgi:predicted Zn finger-like uncharacterized protein
MIVTCLACGTRYLTDPVALGQSGRTVRCAKCGHTWMQAPPVDMPHRVDVLSPATTPADTTPPRFNLPAPYFPPPRRRSGTRLALAIAAAVVVAVVGAGYFARSQIIETWPPAKRVYDLIGSIVGASAAALDAEALRTMRQPVDGIDSLILQVEITNRSQQPQAVPVLRVTLFDAGERGVMDWTFASDLAVLQPGETGRFRTETIDSPQAFERFAAKLFRSGG